MGTIELEELNEKWNEFFRTLYIHTCLESDVWLCVLSVCKQSQKLSLESLFLRAAPLVRYADASLQLSDTVTEYLKQIL